MRPAYHAAAVVLVAAAVAAHEAAAQSFVGAAGETPESTVLVGAHGEIWTRQPGGWQRRSGGTSADLRAVTGLPGALWAIGDRLPLWRHDGRAWIAVVGASGGPVRMGAAGSPLTVVSVKRRVLGGDASRIQTLASLPVAVARVWARGPRDALAVGVDGILYRLKTRWRPVRGAEPVADLCGAGAKVVVLGRSGGVFMVDPRKPRLDAASALRLEGFQPQGCISGSGRTFVYGDGVAMAELTATAIVPLPVLPAPAAAVVPYREGALAVTGGGTLYLLKGDVWVAEAIAAEPPATTPASRAPAGPATIPVPPASR